MTWSSLRFRTLRDSGPKTGPEDERTQILTIIVTVIKVPFHVIVKVKSHGYRVKTTQTV